MVKLKGLGRGLDALFSDSDRPEGETLQVLSVGELQPGKYQPRSHMDQAALMELAASIRSQGLMQPILVRPLPSGRYEIIAGERRWRAAQLAGLVEVTTVVRNVPDAAAAAMSLIENIQREDLNALEQAQAIQRLLDEFGMTHDTAAEALGRSRSAVSNLLRLLNLSDPVKLLLAERKLEMGHARALLSLPVLLQLEAAALVVARQFNVRDTEKLVKRMLLEPAEKLPRKLDPDVARLQEEVSERVGATVRIMPGRKGSGKITIDYATLDQLDDLLTRFK